MDSSWNQDLAHPFHLNKTTNYTPCRARKESQSNHTPSDDSFSNIYCTYQAKYWERSIKGAATTIPAVLEFTTQLGIQALK